MVCPAFPQGIWMPNSIAYGRNRHLRGTRGRWGTSSMRRLRPPALSLARQVGVEKANQLLHDAHITADMCNGAVCGLSRPWSGPIRASCTEHEADCRRRCRLLVAWTCGRFRAKTVHVYGGREPVMRALDCGEPLQTGSWPAYLGRGVRLGRWLHIHRRSESDGLGCNRSVD